MEVITFEGTTRMNAGPHLLDGFRKVRRKVWQLLPHDPMAIERLSRQLGIPPIVAQLLLNRRLHEPDQAQRFLTMPMSGMHEPELLPGVVDATERIWHAIEEKGSSASTVTTTWTASLARPSCSPPSSSCKPGLNFTSSSAHRRLRTQ